MKRDQAASNRARTRPWLRRRLDDGLDTVRLLVRLGRARPDVVVTFTPAFGAVAAIVGRTWGARTVVTHHLTSDAIGAAARGLDAGAPRRGAVHAVLACSEAVAASFAGPVPVRVVANGVPDVA